MFPKSLTLLPDHSSEPEENPDDEEVQSSQKN